MAQFVTDLQLSTFAMRDSDEWKLVSPLIYESDLVFEPIVVPAGFTTDLASVPRLPLAYLIAGGVADAAAVVHDYLYVTQPIPREQADAIFLEAMTVSKVPAWRRWLMWSAVRGFGGPLWRIRTEAIDASLS